MSGGASVTPAGIVPSSGESVQPAQLASANDNIHASRFERKDRVVDAI